MYIVILAHANNAINPYVIFSFSTNYRQGLKALYCSLKMKPRLIEAQGTLDIDSNKKGHKSSHRLERTTPTSEKIEDFPDCFDTRL